MTRLRRKIDTFLIEWKNDKNKLPLIIKGARQIGKTDAIENFAKNNYKNFVEINFALQPEYKVIFDNGFSVDAIISNISLINTSFVFEPGETIIFFDEMQDCINCATSLKSFNIDKRFDVICSGSMMGINYNEIESNSVGNKQDYEMYSMDFEEFLWAKGYSCETVNEMLDHMNELVPFNELELSVYHGLFMDYCILGGMPAVVRNYIATGTFEGSLMTQRQLISDYREDIRKYAQGMDQTRILNVFDQIPPQLSRDNKKFQLSKVASGARFKDYRGCIEWLKDAGIVNVCYCLNFPELPLKGNYDETKYKLYFADTGLLVAMLDEEAQVDLRANKNLGVYKGALYENIVGEALVKSGCGLYYYKRDDSTLEEDFFVRTANNLVPVEVKATNSKSKSLSTLINSEKYSDITYGLKLINGNVGCVNNIYTFPYFCAFLVKKYLSQRK